MNACTWEDVHALREALVITPSARPEDVYAILLSLSVGGGPVAGAKWLSVGPRTRHHTAWGDFSLPSRLSRRAAVPDQKAAVRFASGDSTDTCTRKCLDDSWCRPIDFISVA